MGSLKDIDALYCCLNIVIFHVAPNRFKLAMIKATNLNYFQQNHWFGGEDKQHITIRFQYI